MLDTLYSLKVKNYNVRTPVGGVLFGNLFPLTMIFPVCDPDEMSWSLTLIPSLARDQGGGGSGCCVSDGIIPAYLF